MVEKNDAYWKKRQGALWQRMEKDEKKLSGQLTKYYASEAASFDKEIAAYYAKYGREGVIEYRTLLQRLDQADFDLLMRQMDDFAIKYPQYAHLLPVRESIYKLNRLEGLQQSVRVQQLSIGAMEQKEFDAHLRKYAEMGFKEIGGFNMVDQAMVSRLVGASWLDGENFSQRIWGNHDKLAASLMTDFRNGVIRGDSYDRMAKQFRGKFEKVSKYDAMRLIYTEGTFVMNQSSMEAFITMGYTQYRYSAIVDGRTSEICRELDGDVFEIADRQPGVNFPPMHPWCRSSYTIVTEEIGDYHEQAKSLLEKAKAAEPGITSDLHAAALEAGSRLEGLDFRLKTEDSLTRKISKEPDAVMRDVVRYTSISDPDKLIDQTNKIFEILENKGYTISAVKDTWSVPQSSYKGINTNFRTPDGYEFEIQFHTKESFDLKNGKLHELYEKQRILDMDKDKEEFLLLDREMFKLSDKLERPKNLENLRKGS